MFTMMKLLTFCVFVVFFQFFAFACVAVYGTVDAYFQVYDWRTYTTMGATVKRSISVRESSSQPMQASL